MRAAALWPSGFWRFEAVAAISPPDASTQLCGLFEVAAPIAETLSFLGTGFLAACSVYPTTAAAEILLLQ